MITLSKAYELKYMIMKEIGLSKKQIGKEAMEDYNKLKARKMSIPIFIGGIIAFILLLIIIINQIS